jgi:hypothetical protein
MKSMEEAMAKNAADKNSNLKKKEKLSAKNILPKRYPLTEVKTKTKVKAKPSKERWPK